MDEITLKLEQDLAKASKEASRLNGDKGRPAEQRYAIAYDKLALLGTTSRRRLRAKYRNQ